MTPSFKKRVQCIQSAFLICAIAIAVGLVWTTLGNPESREAARQETLQRTMETIILLQRDFFLTGDEATLRPMILKDVAERAGYDISTISRVSNSKYVQTNFGIYPLKYFFSESMQTDSGEEISTREVKKIMKEHIDGEDKRKPLTDEELASILKEKGYIIARRTVAKYREQLGIPVARLRKEI